MNHTRLISLALSGVIGVTACSIDSVNPLAGGDALDTSAAAAEVRDLVSDSGLNEDGFAQLDTCPHDPGGVLLARALNSIDNTDAVSAQSAPLDPYLVRNPNNDQPTLIACDRFSDLSGVGLLVSERPDDFDRYLDDLIANEDGTIDLTLDRQGSTEHAGGTLHRLCAVDNVDRSNSFCEADWINQDLLITLFLLGPNSTEVDTDELAERLILILPTVIETLAG